jgi:branched-chain amino acid transport system substrate-binding protein
MLLVLAVAIVAVAVLSGCGGLSSALIVPGGSRLTIYSSLPLQGAGAAVSDQIINGERLALAEAGGHVGRFSVSFVSYDDSSRSNDQWNASDTATNAADAAHDISTIAYLGDYDSPATAISLPLINGARILQVSPASPYVGLTDPQFAGMDEPDRFYPTQARTFARLAPDDYVQGAALVDFMKLQGVHSLYVVGDQDEFDSSLSAIVAQDAKADGLHVVAADTIDSDIHTFKSEATKIAASGAQAMFYGGGATPSTANLWQEVYSDDPAMRLFGSSSANVPSFTAGLGAAATNLYLGSATLPTELYDADAQRVLRSYRQHFDQVPTADALYGYEAMHLVLEAIARAGRHGNDRKAVVGAFFNLGLQQSVLGALQISSSGDSNIAEYGIDRIQNGAPVFMRVIRVAQTGPPASV